MTSLGLIPRGVRFINLKFEQLANSNLNQIENNLTFGQVGSKKMKVKNLVGVSLQRLNPRIFQFSGSRQLGNLEQPEEKILAKSGPPKRGLETHESDVDIKIYVCLI